MIVVALAASLVWLLLKVIQQARRADS